MALPLLERVALAALLGPFLISGVVKLLGWADAQAEVRALTRVVAQPWLALATAGVIVLQLGASLWLLAGGPAAWLPALALAAFTLAATWIAHDWRSLPPGPARTQAFNGFWEHVALVGALCHVASVMWRGVGA